MLCTVFPCSSDTCQLAEESRSPDEILIDTPFAAGQVRACFSYVLLAILSSKLRPDDDQLWEVLEEGSSLTTS